MNSTKKTARLLGLLHLVNEPCALAWNYFMEPGTATRTRNWAAIQTHSGLQAGLP